MKLFNTYPPTSAVSFGYVSVKTLFDYILYYCIIVGLFYLTVPRL